MLGYAGDKDSVNHIPNYAEEQLEHATKEEESTIELLRKELKEERELNKYLEKECNKYIELAEARGKNNKKYEDEYKKLKRQLSIVAKERDNAKNGCKKIRKENENIKNEFIIESKELKTSASEATQQYLKIFDEKYELKAELTQLRNERQETEFKLKKYVASEIGYKRIILGLTQAFNELSKNVYGDELEE